MSEILEWEVLESIYKYTLRELPEVSGKYSVKNTSGISVLEKRRDLSFWDNFIKIKPLYIIYIITLLIKSSLVQCERIISF